METISLNQLNIEVINLKKELFKIKKFLNEELEFAKGTEEAWQEIDEGKFRKMGDKEFLKEIDKW